MSGHHRAAGWTGSTVRHARLVVARRMAALWARGEQVVCLLCEEEIQPAQAWDVDHATPLAEGGQAHDPSNWRPVHRRCNQRAGAGMTNRIVGRKKQRLWQW